MEHTANSRLLATYCELLGDSRYGDSMERVLYNTIAGAKPILPDGTSFYYSDYNNDQGKKVYYSDKWPCCSGTFPQLTADYGISAYYPSADGIFVNLFIPSADPMGAEQNPVHGDSAHQLSHVEHY